MVQKKEKKYMIVLGSLFGDEGKGRTVNELVKEEIRDNKKVVVIRYSGGPQAGHCVNEANHTNHIFSTYGSGSLNGADTYLDSMFMFDPISFIKERKVLIEDIRQYKDEDTVTEPKVWIHNRCRIITPYDVLAGRNNNDVLRHGTCGKGIYSTFKRYEEKFGISYKFSMYNNENDVEWILKNPEKYLKKVKEYYKDSNISKEDKKKYDKMFFGAINHINGLIDNEIVKLRNEDFRRSGLYDTIIYEGSQGLLLDMDRGFMPHCTPSRVGLNGIPSSITRDPNTEVYLVMRTYLTRHGNGYDPEEEDNKLFRSGLSKRFFSNFREIIEKSFMDVNFTEINEYNDYQLEFKFGMFNMNMLNRAFDRHNLDNYPVKYNLMITHFDVLDNMVTSKGGWPFINKNNAVEMSSSGIDFANEIVSNSNIKIDKVFMANQNTIFQYK